MRAPYTKQQVIDAIERKSTSAVVPTMLCTWWGEGLVEKHGKQALDTLQNEYPDDVITTFYKSPGETVSTTDNPEYRFGFQNYTGHETHSIGKACVLLEDWDDLDAFAAHMPACQEPHVFDGVRKAVEAAGDRYVAGCFWRVFHERLWAIRGMENLMCDYYDDMPNLKRLGRMLLEYNKGLVDGYAACGVDGIFTSDDLGHQTGPMMSPAIFRELYLPLYAELIEYTHQKGLHFILHSCGDNSLLMEPLIEAGVDVFHPIQTGCMDVEKTVRDYGDRISFLWGVDVQHLLPEESPQTVEQVLRKEKALLYKQQGGLLIAAGNGIMADTSLENLRAMLRVTHEDERETAPLTAPR
ncbi:MAG: uroporphyrinogen decarboxylase family protein [Clostridia bacterium]